MDKVLLRVGHECNNNCIFCHLGKSEKTGLTSEEVKRKILLCKNKGYKFIIFSGGEPTIRKDILNISRFAKEKKIKLGLITNGRMLSYKKFLDNLIKNNMSYFYISIQGSNEKIHNSITNSESFNQTIEGLENVAKLKRIYYIVNVTVTQRNIDDLIPIVEILSKRKVKRVKFSLLECKGNVFNNKEIIPPLTLSTRKIKEAIDYANLNGMTALISDAPLCLLGEYSNFIDNLETNGIAGMIEIDENEVYPTDSKDKIKTPLCKNCKKQEVCKGIDCDYASVRGYNELSNKGKISNSSFFRFKESHSKIKCNLMPKDIKKIVLFDNNSYKLYECYSQDFTEQEINEIKNLWQVYLSENIKKRGGKAHLLKLRERNKCTSCHKKELCARIFEKTKLNVKEDFLNSLKNELKNIRGKILDIGCGEIALKDLFIKFVKEKKISYLGIDPKAKTSKDLKVLKSRFESQPFPRECFNAVLMLGSYNHLEDIDSVLKKAFNILKKSGVILLSEDMPFIVLGKNKADKRKEFEHFRNENMKIAVLKLKRAGFSVIKAKDVSKEKSNNWVILAKK